ncbi:MAG: hypothetical protein AAGB32_03530 [Pseudomonadota bacterium]
MSENDRDQLKSHLIVPLAVSDILYHDLDVAPDMQYGLHMALSEIDPDSALLAIALCAHDIAEKNLIYVPIASALKKEADNIIEEYGRTWLRHHNNGPMPSDIYASILCTVGEDLEALADLMDALCADLDIVNEATPILCNLLSVQARAHIEITDFILAEIKSDHDMMAAPAEETAPVAEKQAEFAGDNIILFPGTAK